MSVCTWCDEPITADDPPISQLLTIDSADPAFSPMASRHAECLQRSLFGGANHIKGTCICQGGPNEPDNPALSRRDAARAAVMAMRERLAAVLKRLPH